MKWISLLRRIGKQPLRFTQRNEVKVFVGNREYLVTGIRYANGVPQGLEVEEGDDKNTDYRE